MDRNKKKNDQLGMPVGTASNKLRKMIIFQYAQRCGHDNCHQCGEKIGDIKDFSIEHKTPYLDSENPVEVFFDLENIAFSHLNCNVAAARRSPRPRTHGISSTYDKGCRCEPCRLANNKRKRIQREKYSKIK